MCVCVGGGSVTSFPCVFFQAVIRHIPAAARAATAAAFAQSEPTPSSTPLPHASPPSSTSPPLAGQPARPAPTTAPDTSRLPAWVATAFAARPPLAVADGGRAKFRVPPTFCVRVAAAHARGRGQPPVTGRGLADDGGGPDDGFPAARAVLRALAALPERQLPFMS
jgi:hypothetical protein